MTAGRREVLRYLDRACPGARLTPIAGDASTRTFHRVTLVDGSTRVLMDHGRPLAGESDDVALARVFVEAGLPVARILDTCREAGCLLMEDLGCRTLEAVLGAGPPERGGDGIPVALQRAVRLAARVGLEGTAALARSDRASGPALDGARFRWEMDFFLTHFAGGLCGRQVGAKLERALAALADGAAETPRRVLCHRDFHSRNLMVGPDGSLSMVDIQDARWGPDGYDLASILYDAYLEVDDDWRPPLIETFLVEMREDPPPAGFRDRLDRVAAQRMIKALGTFGFQIHSRGEVRYAPAVTRTQRRLGRLLSGWEAGRRLSELLDQAGLLRAPAA